MIRIAIVDDEREILELLFRIIDDTLKRDLSRHCEERGDAAIRSKVVTSQCVQRIPTSVLRLFPE